NGHRAMVQNGVVAVATIAIGGTGIRAAGNRTLQDGQGAVVGNGSLVVGSVVNGALTVDDQSTVVDDGIRAIHVGQRVATHIQSNSLALRDAETLSLAGGHSHGDSIIVLDRIGNRL